MAYQSHRLLLGPAIGHPRYLAVFFTGKIIRDQTSFNCDIIMGILPSSDAWIADAVSRQPNIAAIGRMQL